MPNGLQPKHAPLEALRVYMMGPLVVRVFPEDLVDLVAEKDLTVIAGRSGWRDQHYLYIAHDPREGITYFSIGEEKLPELTVAITAKAIDKPSSFKGSRTL